MLAITKNMPALDRAVRDRRYGERDSAVTCELAGRTTLLLGFGRIGRAAAQLCTAFRMHCLVHDPGVPRPVIEAAGFEVAVD